MFRRTSRFHYEAIEEAEAAQRWYSERSLVAARAFTAELSHAVEIVSESPERWPRFSVNTRRYVLPRFPFSLVYRMKDNVIEIVAVAHHKRRPGYWRHRS
jgi:plasmid stabilization system protein ParE